MAWLNRDTARGPRCQWMLVFIYPDFQAQWRPNICSAVIWYNMTADSYQFLFSLSWQTELWWKNYSFFFLFNLLVTCSEATNVANAWCVPGAEELLGLLLSLSRLANSLTNCDPAEWKSGEQGNVNRVQLGFVPCLFPANRLRWIPTLTYWNEW